MEQLIDGYWEQWDVVKVVAVGVILFVLIRIVFKSIKILAAKYKKDFGYKRYFPLLEMAIWLSFLYWSLGQIFNEPVYYSVFFITISVIGLVWLGWFGLRDYIAGIILRAQDVYDSGHQLSVGKIIGKISKLGYLNIEVQQEDGSVLKIPYSKVASRIHLNKNVKNMVVTDNISIRIPGDSILSEEINRLRMLILNSPWHVSYTEPVIRKKAGDKDDRSLEIIVSTIGKNGLEKLQSEIEKSIDKKVRKV